MPKIVEKPQRKSIRKCYAELRAAHLRSNPDTLSSTIFQMVSNIFDLNVSTIRNIVNEEDDKEFHKCHR
ncbi:uncharacterized protein LOC123319394 [Coccinella septempunctata]|uniref:uncharacterized protein LOC123319394 n=1 Tax=Coccinella septempunctata TaxID=41139 RepID=UPI001D0667D1|nr:uncharacterized protein LOC123319394 [Coccinella septempunctata]